MYTCTCIVHVNFSLYILLRPGSEIIKKRVHYNSIYMSAVKQCESIWHVACHCKPCYREGCKALYVVQYPKSYVHVVAAATTTTTTVAEDEQPTTNWISRYRVSRPTNGC